MQGCNNCASDSNEVLLCRISVNNSSILMDSLEKNIVVIGGGNSAHVLIPLLSDAHFNITLLTSRPRAWRHTIELEYRTPNDEVLNVFKGEINVITDNPQDCIPNADYIILCMPVFQYRVALHRIAPYISRNKEVVIGTVYGQGGFNWMVEEIQKRFQLTNLIYFAFGLIPWVCRTKEYGHTGITYGVKARNAAAVYPKEHFDRINNEFFDPICYHWFKTGNVEQLDNFLSITLSVDNQIIHPTRCYAICKEYGGTWSHAEDVPLFYKDYDTFSANCLADLDEDYSKVRDRIKRLYPDRDFHYMLNYLDLEHYTYDSTSVDIMDSFVNSPTLQAIATPVSVDDNGNLVIDKNGRFFMDDIYYGIAIVKWMAELLHVDVPMIDKLLHWAQNFRDEQIISKDNQLLLNSNDLCAPMKSGIPYYYGMKTIDEIVD